MNCIPQQQDAPMSANAGRPQCAASGSGDQVRQQVRHEHHRARTKSTVEDFVMVTPPLVALPVTVTV
jgi:hypothetical protein